MSNTVRKHRPDMPEGMFGNPGKAKGRVINKQEDGAVTLIQLSARDVEQPALLSGGVQVRPAVKPYIGSRWDVSSILTTSTKY